MTVNDLTIAGSNGGQNTLLLNYVGTNVPLRTLNDLNIREGGTMVNLHSGLIVGELGQGTLRVFGGQIFQDGGFTEVRSPALLGGNCSITNGRFSAGYVEFSGLFNQYQAAVTIAELRMSGGVYNLYGGDLSVDRLEVGTYGNGVSFIQQGGRNHTFFLDVGQQNIHSSMTASYSLNGGLLSTSDVFLGSAGTFIQNAGVHTITNGLEISGEAIGHGYPQILTPARYLLTNGILSARSIVLHGISGTTEFAQEGGTTIISESLQFGTDTGYRVGTFSLDGGILTCSNVVSSGSVVDIFQNGGSFITTNLFSFAGYGGQVDYYSIHIPPRYAQYHFTGGTLMASNIELAAETIIGSSTNTGRITNPGYFK
ncbi:MAG: hypothetical protein ACR2H1_06415, partial [Limisphaerales bacterium]